MDIDWDNLMDRFERTLPPERRTAQYKHMRQWQAEDGWIIGYTTTRVINSRHDGKFLVVAYRPFGKGSRSGKAKSWKLHYQRSYAKRTDAKSRALALFAQHSPKWAARNTG